LDKAVSGRATRAEIDLISSVASDITGNTICAFGDGAAQPALSFVSKFRTNLDDYVENGGRKQTGKLTVPGVK
jgi:NADH-quinone oxidoreductase subunit F